MSGADILARKVLTANMLVANISQTSKCRTLDDKNLLLSVFKKYLKEIEKKKILFVKYKI